MSSLEAMLWARSVAVVGASPRANSLGRHVVVQPMTPPGVEMMLGVAPLLGGVRGAPPVDRAALNEAVAALSLLASDLGDLLAGVDINPLVVWPDPRPIVGRDAGALPCRWMRSHDVVRCGGGRP